MLCSELLTKIAIKISGRTNFRNYDFGNDLEKEYFDICFMAQTDENCDNKTALDKAFDEAIASLEYKTCFYASKEKAVVSAWIAKLKSSNTTLDEMRLRNDIVKYLLDLANAKAVVPAPFNEAPKTGTITELAKSFPPSIPIVCKTDATRNFLLEMFDNSPDNGNFLASQPVPKSGTFCYFILRKVKN